MMLPSTPARNSITPLPIGTRIRPLAKSWNCFLLAAATIAAALSFGHSAQAAALYYDGGTNTWINTSFSTDPVNPIPDPGSAPGIGDDITFNVSSNNAVANILSLGGNQSANSLTFSNTLANTINSSAADQTLTLGGSGGTGITVNSGAGVVTIGSSTTAANRTNVLLGASQSWINNSTNVEIINNGVAGTATTGNTQTLTLNGAAGGWTFTGNTTAITDGTGGGNLALTLNTGNTSTGGAVTLSSANSYTGGTTITRGRITASLIGSFGTGLVTIQSSGANVGGQALLSATGIYANDFNIAGNGNGEANQGYAIRFGGGTTLGNALGTNTLTIASTGATIGASTGTTAVSYTINSKITGSGALNLIRGGTGVGGTATAIFANANNDYTGQTTINGSAFLQLNASTAAQNSVISIGNANGLTFNGLTAATIGGLAGASAEALTNLAAGNVALTIGNNNNTGMTYSGVLSGGGSLIKTGTGTQTLSGASTFTGNATLSQGTIALGSSSLVTAGALVSGPLGVGTVKLGSGTNTANLQTNAAATRTLSNNISLDGDLTLSSSAATGRIALNTLNGLTTANTITLTRTNTLTAASTMTVDLIGAIGDGGSAFGLTLGGGGIYHIGSVASPDTVANTYTGLTTVSGGSVDVNKTANTNAIAGNLTINGGTFTLGANNENIANTSTVTVNAGGTFAMNSRTETIGNLTVAGGTLSASSGTMTIAGAGSATVGSGLGTTSTISSALVLGTGDLLINPNSNGIVNITGGITSTTTGSDITITNAGTGAVTLGTTAINNQGTITNNGGGTNTTTISSVIGTNVTSVIQNSATSVMSLSGANTQTGTLQVQNGTVALGNTATYLTSSGGTGTVTLGTSGAANTTLVTFSNIGRTFANQIVTQGTGGTNTFQSNGGGQNFTFTGGFTLGNNLTLSTYNGTDSITVQTGAIGGTGNLVTNVTTTNAATGATGVTSGGVITINSGVNNAGTVTNSGNGSAAVTINGIIGNSVTGVTQNSTTSSLILAGANTYGTATSATTTVNAGTLQLSGSGTLGNTKNNLVVNTGGTLDLNNTSQGVGALSGTGGTITNVTGTATAKTLTVGNNNATGGSYAGVIADSSNNAVGTLALTKTGTGTQTLTGANTYTGATTIGTTTGGGSGAGVLSSPTANGGKLEAAGNGALGSGGTYSAPQVVGTPGAGTSGIAVNNGGTLLLSGTTTQASGVIGGVYDRVSNTAGISLGTSGAVANSVGGTIAIAPTSGNPVLEGTAFSRSNASTTAASPYATGSATSVVGLGALTLSSSSTLDFGNGGVGTLVFSSFTPSGFTLNITNYSNSAFNFTNSVSGVDGTNDRLVFQQDQTSNLARFNFGTGITAQQIQLDNGFYEVGFNAVPEPTTVIAAVALLGFVGYRETRRLRRLSKKFIGNV